MKMKINIEDKTFNVEINDLHARPIQANVDGEIFEVWPEESTRPVTAAMPAAPQPAAPATAPVSSPGAASGNAVIAPIPGVIIEIKVTAGDSVTYGQELCVLEAMKMKNSIRANHAGTIAKVLVSTGDQVQQGKVLMEFQDKAG
jgi:biotin carboxyl carrier protein